MAKVEKVEEQKAKKFEPWVTITLSKREAAGLCCLMAASHFDTVPWKLFNELDELFVEGGFDWERSGIQVKDGLEVTKFLNEEFGEGQS